MKNLETEIIGKDIFEIPEVDPIIIANFKESLNPREEFSYRNEDHLKRAIEDEKAMREKN